MLDIFCCVDPEFHAVCIRLMHNVINPTEKVYQKEEEEEGGGPHPIVIYKNNKWIQSGGDIE